MSSRLVFAARGDPLLSDRSWAISSYRPDFATLCHAPARIVIAVGEQSIGTFTGRTSAAAAEQLGQQPAVFPGHHGGFRDGIGRPEAFARQLRQVLDEQT